MRGRRTLPSSLAAKLAMLGASCSVVELPRRRCRQRPDPRRSAESVRRAAPCSCSKARSAITAMPFPQRKLRSRRAKGRASRLGRPNRSISVRRRDRPLASSPTGRGRGAPTSAVNIRFGFDPLGAMATRGVVPKPWTELARPVASLITGFVEQGFNGPFFVADGRPVHAAGGSEAQELAFALAGHAVAYFRALEAEGMSSDQARRLIFFRLAADQDQFLTIASRAKRSWAPRAFPEGLSPYALASPPRRPGA